MQAAELALAFPGTEDASVGPTVGTTAGAGGCSARAREDIVVACFSRVVDLVSALLSLRVTLAVHHKHAVVSVY
jgi:hypothetical protein